MYTVQLSQYSEHNQFIKWANVQSVWLQLKTIDIFKFKLDWRKFSMEDRSPHCCTLSLGVRALLRSTSVWLMGNWTVSLGHYHAFCAHRTYLLIPASQINWLGTQSSLISNYCFCCLLTSELDRIDIPIWIFVSLLIKRYTQLKIIRFYQMGFWSLLHINQRKKKKILYALNVVIVSNRPLDAAQFEIKIMVNIAILNCYNSSGWCMLHTFNGHTEWLCACVQMTSVLLENCFPCVSDVILLVQCIQPTIGISPESLQNWPVRQEMGSIIFLDVCGPITLLFNDILIWRNWIHSIWIIVAQMLNATWARTVRIQRRTNRI